MLGTDGQIGRYEIRRRLAYGGMGTLYLAHDPVLDRTVALKLFHADLEGPEARDRFVREARAVAALNNPNIVTIYDYGEYSSQPFLVMEHIDGETVASLIRRRPTLPSIVKVRWLEDLCAAVGYAHERGIIHRDIKPANLMIDAYGRIKVLDFGIARMRGSFANPTTGLLGTPGYVSPEQIRGSTADRRSDVFAIGVVSYELLSYVEPFGTGTTLAMSHRILNEDPVPLDTLQPGISADLSAIVARALMKDPDQRFDTAESMRDALAGVRRYLEASEPETVSTHGLARSDTGQSLGPAGAGSAARPPTTPGDATGGQAAAAGDLTPRTPAKTPRRTTREALARQREEQLQAWVQLARDHLADGEITEAREACAQALKLEPAHAEALQLLGSMGPESAGTGGRVRTPGASAPPVAARPDRSTAERAATTGFAALEPEPLATGQPGQMPIEAASPVVVVSPIGTSLEPALKAEVVVAGRSRGRGLALLAGATIAGLAIAAGAYTWFAGGPRAPAPIPVLVVIDASPWARVQGIRQAGGELESLPPDASTPLALPLAPGSYQVSLVGPPPASERRDVSLQVAADSKPRVFEAFTSMTADDYLREIARSRDQSQRSAP
jgi:hypothetical protein